LYAPWHIDQSIVGQRVVEGVKANELYIITHPNFRDIFERRFNGIREAPTGARC